MPELLAHNKAKPGEFFGRPCAVSPIYIKPASVICLMLFKTGSLSRLHLRTGQGREQQCRKNGNDCNYHQQFDERESMTLRALDDVLILQTVVFPCMAWFSGPLTLAGFHSGARCSSKDFAV